jgi:hypothetical protein
MCPSIRSLFHAVNMTEVGTRNICSFHDTDDSLFRRAIHDGQRQAVALDKQFQGPIKLVIGPERSDIAAHQVRSDDQGTKGSRLRS